MGHEIYRVTAFTTLDDYVLHIWFDDETEQIINFEPVLHGPIFGPLQDPALFKQVQLLDDVGCLEWPTGADFDPETLHNWPAYKDEIIADRHQRFAIPS